MRPEATPRGPAGARVLLFRPTAGPGGPSGDGWLRDLRQSSRREDATTRVPEELVASVLSAWRAAS